MKEGNIVNFPKLEKRFMPAENSEARARLDQFRNSVKEYQKKHVEVLGATVYGSMIKGSQAKKTSDIDAFVYIDGDKIPEQEKSKDKDVIESEYRLNFLNSLNDPEGEKTKYYEDLRFQILNEELLDKNIDYLVEYESKDKEYQKILEQNYKYDMADEEKDKLLSQRPNAFPKDFFAVAGMFHARVGTGIEKYRKLFLEKINDLSDKKMAEKIWNDIFFSLKTYEQRADSNKITRIPESLAEATRTYYPELQENLKQQQERTVINNLTEKIKSLY
jgi:predicted nucleotidyltransferase